MTLRRTMSVGERLVSKRGGPVRGTKRLWQIAQVAALVIASMMSTTSEAYATSTTASRTAKHKAGEVRAKIGLQAIGARAATEACQA